MRTIPLGDLAMENVRLADSGFVFIDEVGRALHPNALTDAFRTRLRQTSKYKVFPNHIHI